MRNFFFSELPSTNEKARFMKPEYPDEELWIYTDNQFKGKGQSDNCWLSQTGANITGSLVVYPKYLRAREQFMLSKVISLAACDFLELFLPDVRIKWPNDLYIDDKKAGGILIENDIEGEMVSNSIIGVGININQLKFDAKLPNPVSLSQITEIQYDLEEMINLFLDVFMPWYSHLERGENQFINGHYINKLYRYKEFAPYRIKGKWVEAKIVNVNEYGHLILKLKSGEEQSFDLKEIEFILD
ncbi:MAG: biotin--[acetyl-CoA-carboxylase] ligase [Bacteroidetes bacterium]|nr:biotin--[acetyl-CoA-carboxylase] ligase [Bacteroidota bacterium]MBT4400193.1 biotin--[acetyl-CoA-carboxylase] ligase [Bacteroidota bacterium]